MICEQNCATCPYSAPPPLRARLAAGVFSLLVDDFACPVQLVALGRRRRAGWRGGGGELCQCQANASDYDASVHTSYTVDRLDYRIAANLRPPLPLGAIRRAYGSVNTCICAVDHRACAPAVQTLCATVRQRPRPFRTHGWSVSPRRHLCSLAPALWR